MGRGGTKFVGEAVAHRKGKGKGNSSKDMRKNMERFLETGVHPELEAARREAGDVLHPLPDVDTNRPFVFIDLQQAGKPLGEARCVLHNPGPPFPSHRCPMPRLSAEWTTRQQPSTLGLLHGALHPNPLALPAPQAAWWWRCLRTWRPLPPPTCATAACRGLPRVWRAQPCTSCCPAMESSWARSERRSLEVACLLGWLCIGIGASG